MSKELSAKEYARVGGLFPDNIPYAFAEAYANHVATARLEAYKAEVVEWLKSQADFITDDDDERDRYARSAYLDVIYHLNSTPEYTEAEQNCRGCMGPCGQCETKKESDESK